MERITLRLLAPPDPEARYQRLVEDLRAGIGAEVDCDELLLMRIRVGIAEGELTASEVRVLFGNEEIKVDKSGALPHRPATLFSSRLFALTNRLLRSVAKRASGRAA